MSEETADEFDAAVVAARATLENAHAPYSGRREGAALLDADGHVHTGATVECASPGASITATQAALAKALAAGAKEFSRLALVNDQGTPRFPCGVSREALREFAPSVMVVAETVDGQRAAAPLNELLPNAG